MSFGTWLDTAIGVALFFLAMSFLVSAVVEAISQIMAWRAATLREGIANLLNSVGMGASAKSEDSPAGTNYLKTIYDHSLMRGLYDSSSPRLTAWRANLGNGTMPSYVPGSIFASALLDVVTTNTPLAKAQTSLAGIDKAIRNLRDATPGQEREQALTDLDKEVAPLEAAVAAALAEITPAAGRGIARLAQRKAALSTQREAALVAGDAKRIAALDALLQACDADRSRLEASVGTWGDALNSAKATAAVETRFATMRAAIATPHEAGDPVSWNQRMSGIDAAAKSLRESIAQPMAALASASSDTDRWLGDARDLIARIEIPELRAALGTMVDSANTSVADLRKAVAAWFDTSMDRVSGWYKRRVQMMSFVVGIVVAATINADAINVVRTIATNETLRGELVALAQATAKESDEKMRAKVLQEKLGVLPIGWFIAECVDRVTGQECLDEDAGHLATPHSDRQWRPTSSYATWSSVTDPNISLNWSPLSILGWIITAFAVKLGAPFWFDLLSSLLKVRSAGKVPARSGSKPSDVTGGGAAP